ncbi:MAG: methyltransferase [Mariprofundaceae bacterium]
MSRVVSGTVERLLPGGEAILHAEGEVFLVTNAIPGDRVILSVDKKRRGVHRGSIQEVLIASADRMPPSCVDADHCGGCALQYLDPAQHHRYKASWVEEAFQNFLTSDTTWAPDLPSSTMSLRRRVRWWTGVDSTGRFLGYRKRSSHHVTRISHCAVILPELEQVREELQTWLPESVLSVQATQLADGLHLVLEAESSQPVGFSEMFDKVDGLVIQWWWRSKGATVPINRPVVLLHDHLPVGKKTIALRVGPDDFVQGQASGNQAMIRQIQIWADHLSCRRVVDLFAGIGNLSLPLAAVRASIDIVGAEVRPQSVRAANETARQLNLNALYHVVNLFAAFDSAAFSGADLMIIDPPRKGAKQVCAQLPQLLPKSVILCSCDIASGARDAEMLVSSGYRLQALRVFDLFPYAGHVEAMSLWTQ